MSKDPKVFTHESYVKVGLSRTMYGGSGVRLFGSPITHHNTIYLRVVRCEYTRDDIAHDRHHGTGEELLEVELSPEQFAQMITTMNIDNGVACTLRRLDGKRMEDPPYVSQREMIREEFNDMVNAIEDRELNPDREVARRLLLEKRALTAAEKRMIHGLLCEDINMKSNLKYVARSFDETCERTVTAAKAEVDALFTSTIQRLGIEKLSELSERKAPELVALNDGDELELAP